jgi:hypothetical protein
MTHEKKALQLQPGNGNGNGGHMADQNHPLSQHAVEDRVSLLEETANQVAQEALRTSLTIAHHERLLSSIKVDIQGLHDRSIRIESALSEADRNRQDYTRRLEDHITQTREGFDGVHGELGSVQSDVKGIGKSLDGLVSRLTRVDQIIFRLLLLAATIAGAVIGIEKVPKLLSWVLGMGG